eukprot:7391462-Prymnesium_polylepis.2
MSASHSLRASAVAHSLRMRVHASSNDSIHAPCRPTLNSAGLQYKADDGALQCTASGCSGSSGDSEPATSHLPSLRAAASPSASSGCCPASHAPSSTMVTNTHASPRYRTPPFRSLASSLSRKWPHFHHRGSERHPSRSRASATDDRAAARAPVGATSAIALSTAVFSAANAIPHTCRRRQLPSTRRSYRPALGAEWSRLNFRLKMHRQIRSTTSASSNDTHTV